MIFNNMLSAMSVTEDWHYSDCVTKILFCPQDIIDLAPQQVILCRLCEGAYGRNYSILNYNQSDELNDKMIK